MIHLKKDLDKQTITVTIDNVSITISIGEWSKIIAHEGTAVYGLVKRG
jgi:hypothetical protein